MEITPQPNPETVGPTVRSMTFRDLLAVRDFRLLWSGEAVSMLGDQVHFIVLPWLVLQLAGSAFAIGTVMAVAGIPRALFMLVGGALTDRFAPRNLMLGSNLVRLLLVALMALLTLTGQMALWMIYVAALLFGLVDAFFFPAAGAILPQLLCPEGLASGNALIQGTAQVMGLVGPVLAGLMLVLFAGSRTAAASSPDLAGIGLAFAFDACTFLVSAWTLWLIRVERRPAEGSAADVGVLAAIGAGLAFVWHDRTLRALFLIVAVINFFANGPILVGIPLLAGERFPQGPAAFGILMSAYGGGSLAGTLLAGTLPSPAPARLGCVLLLLAAGLGLGIAAIGLMSTIWPAALVMALTGVANGYVNILFITWLQSHTPQAMLGRVMSLLMFASVGLMPVSMALFGALLDLHATSALVSAGLIIVGVALLSALDRDVRRMGLHMVQA